MFSRDNILHSQYCKFEYNSIRLNALVSGVLKINIPDRINQMYLKKYVIREVYPRCFVAMFF